MDSRISPLGVGGAWKVANDTISTPAEAPEPAPETKEVPVRQSQVGSMLEQHLAGAVAKATLAAVGIDWPSPYHHTDGPAGAYYRKVESARSPDSRSIEGTAVLPEPQFDPGRWRMEVADQPWKEGPRDRPSVYLGGNSGNREVDAGLTWDRVYTPSGEPTFTTEKNGWTRDQGDVFTRKQDGRFINVATGEVATKKQIAAMKPNCAFRPYVRTSNVPKPGLTEEQKTAEKAKNWHTPRRYPNQTKQPANVYFYPGDEVTMTFGTVRPTANDTSNVQLSISANDKSNRSYTGAHHQENWPGKDFTFKRVNSLDQVGGEESKQVDRTNTVVTGGGWKNAGVRDKDNHLTPLTAQNGHEVRGKDTSQNYPEVFKFRQGSFGTNGSEFVDIIPSGNR